ncbi:unnamed protein product, partial [Scytosiphon promiscuus]
MPRPRHCPVGRIRQRVAGSFLVALWLLGTVQCLVAPPLARLLGAQQHISNRARLPSHQFVRQRRRDSRARTHVMLTPGG